MNSLRLKAPADSMIPRVCYGPIELLAAAVLPLTVLTRLGPSALRAPGAVGRFGSEAGSTRCCWSRGSRPLQGWTVGPSFSLAAKSACPDCGLTSASSAELVVIVGRAGKITWVGWYPHFLAQ